MYKRQIIQRALRAAKRQFPDLYYITDVCLCEYTSHGHCGLLRGQEVDNDPTIRLLAKTALSQVQAGADMVAPSDMMDGRVAAIRALLDEKGYENTPIMSYAVKYASGFYAPFRDAAESAPSFGDRSSYQMDYHNSRAVSYTHLCCQIPPADGLHLSARTDRSAPCCLPCLLYTSSEALSGDRGYPVSQEGAGGDPGACGVPVRGV